MTIGHPFGHVDLGLDTIEPAIIVDIGFRRDSNVSFPLQRLN